LLPINIENEEFDMKKICSTCGEEKDISHFVPRYTAKDGYRNTCKICLHEQKIERIKKHKENRNTQTYIVKETKQCSSCNEVKEIKLFGISSESKDGYRNVCKKCKRAQAKALAQKRIEERGDATTIEFKMCSGCKETKGVEHFPKDRGRPDGYGCYCNECHSLNSKKTRSKTKASEKIIPQTKFCKTCKQTKNIDDFGIKSNASDGHTSACKDCINIRLKKRRIKNKETQTPEENVA
jgi:hypothetical protein